MSTDRELLELAAKAAGIKAKWFRVTKWKDTGTCKISTGKAEVFGTHHSKPWNPLTDDGDALRLAASTRLRVDFYDNHVEVKDGCDLYMIGNEDFENTFVRIEPLEHHGDLLSAARRAIVRAAAEIGRSMP